MSKEQTSFVKKYPVQLAGALWVGANAFMVSKGYLSSDPVLLVTGTTDGALSALMAFGSPKNQQRAAVGMICTGAALAADAGIQAAMSLKDGWSAVSHAGDAGLGLGAVVGATLMFFGPQVTAAANAVPPIKRLLSRFPKTKPEKLGEAVLLASFGSELVHAAAHICQGMAERNAGAILEALGSVALVGMFAAGNNIFSNGVPVAPEVQKLTSHGGSVGPAITSAKAIGPVF